MPQWMQQEMMLAFRNKNKHLIIEWNKNWRLYLRELGINLKG